jgi:hypothetical protein
MIRKLFAVCTLTVVSAASTVQPVSAQQWGLLYPDGSIRQRGVLIDGPNPARIIQQRTILPMNQQSIDLQTGIIRRGTIMQSGPDPSLRLQICMQTGICG